jgi:hypothetical protein
MLWTAVVAAYLSFLGITNQNVSDATLTTCWVAGVLVLRGILNARTAALASFAAGAVMGGLSPYSTDVESTLILSILGGLMGFFVFFVPVQIVCVAIDWLDNLMRTKTDD